MPTYSIKDLENLTGVQTHTIRIWEQRYNLLSPDRTATNNRVYSSEDLRKLMFAALLNNNGMKISKIAELSEDEINDAVLRLTASSDANTESHIEKIKLIMVEMNEAHFEKMFSHLVLHYGFEEIVIRIIIPLFKRLFYFRHTNSISISQMNFMNAMYKQKIYVAIDGLPPPKNPNHKTFILFLPEREHFDLGLLFCNFMARKRGFNTLYIGGNIPIRELQDIIEKNPHSYLLSVASMTATDLNEYYSYLLSLCNAKQKLFLTGNQIGTVTITDPRLTIFHDYTEYKNFLDKL